MTHLPRDPERGEIRDDALPSAPLDGGEADVRSPSDDLSPPVSPAPAGVPDEVSGAVEHDEVIRDGVSGMDIAPPPAAADAPPHDAAPEGKEDEKPRSGILEAIALVCVAFALALTLKSYVAEAYEIKGRSMEPSFSTGQRVIVLKAFYEVQRSDVVVFASSEDAGKDLIKRVVGLPGDEIVIREGRVFVNGERLEESYVEYPVPRYEPAREETVPLGEYYVLGDNRPDSHDSRYFRSVRASQLKGEVVLRWWPFEDFDFFVK